MSNDFKALLDKQMKKATGAVAEPSPKTLVAAKKPEPEPPVAQETPVTAEPETTEERAAEAKRAPAKAKVVTSRGGKNINRVTVNLFEADSRALAVIREKLGSEGHDFTSRSDSIKIGLRLATKAKPDELAKLLEEVKKEDRRYSHEPANR